MDFVDSGNRFRLSGKYIRLLYGVLFGKGNFVANKGIVIKVDELDLSNRN